jgi:hypothetical protein
VPNALPKGQKGYFIKAIPSTDLVVTAIPRSPDNAYAAPSNPEAFDVTHIAVTPSKPRLFGVFGSPEGITLGPFGDSGTGKTILLLGMFVMAGTGRDVIPGLTPPTARRVLYLDYERRLIPNRRRLDMIALGADVTIPEDRMFMYEPEHDLDTADGLAEVQRVIASTGAELLFLDSGSYVSGLDPKDKDASDVLAKANRLFALPMIVPLHTPKDDRDPSKPYGSNYWPAIALETHSVVSIGGIKEQTTEDGHVIFQSSPHTVVVRNRKTNDDEPAMPWAVTIGWPEKNEDGTYEKDAVITYTAADPGLAQKAYREKVARETGALGGRKAIEYDYLTPYVIAAMPIEGADYTKAAVRRDVEHALTIDGKSKLHPSNDGWSEVWKQLDDLGLILSNGRMNVKRPESGETQSPE